MLSSEWDDVIKEKGAWDTLVWMGGLTHYATGPAPIYFGAGYLTQAEWWKIGFICSIVNVICFLGVGTLWWKVIGLW